jgi:hypothetical protein
MKIRTIICSGLVCLELLLAMDSMADKTVINLKGKWAFEVDEKDQGETQAWFNKDLKKSIKLPGSMSENNYGKYGNPGKLGVPEWANWKENKLWHPVLRKDYRGAAWYQRDVEVPAS